MDTPISFVPKQ